MKEDKFKNTVINAAKWSSFTEAIAKVINPVTNMILARILAPEAFGIIATITMIISFTDILTDAGIQKYLIQRDFESDDELYQYADVAFWSNFVISCLLWIIIIFNSDQIAVIVGNPGLGLEIIWASIQLPITAFSGIQLALFRRGFNYKKLFNIRIVEVLIPLIITIPLSFIFKNHWALIIGTIVSRLATAILLTLKSHWKPKLSFKVNILRSMLNFSAWSLLESFVVWLTLWIDALIVAQYLDNYYLGIYKTSTTMVNGLFGIITTSTMSIVLATLSRLQHNPLQFKKTYLIFQKYISLITIPLGVGIFMYSDLATRIFLGDQWSEASIVIGLWALSSAFVIVFSQYSGTVYKAKGNPKLAFISQILHLIFLIPTVFIGAQVNFTVLVYSRTLIRLQAILVNLIIMKKFLGMSYLSTLKNVFPALISSLMMFLSGYLLKGVSNNYAWSFLSILICMIIYIATLNILFKDTIAEIFEMINNNFPKLKDNVIIKFLLNNRLIQKSQ